MLKNNYTLGLSSKSGTWLIPIMMLTSGCAGSAGSLPTDRASSTTAEIESELKITEEDKRLSCTQLQNERQEVITSTEKLEKQIEGNRGRNQVAGYFGALFLLPLVAVENDTEAKEELAQLQLRRDQLNYLSVNSNCN